MDNQEHKTSLLKIKEALIDIKIQPLIIWLNSFDSVMTTYCCQGVPENDPKEEWNKPYAKFVCGIEDDLIEILKKVYEFDKFVKHKDMIQVKVQLLLGGFLSCFIRENKNFVEYHMIFNNQKYLFYFQDFLTNKIKNKKYL